MDVSRGKPLDYDFESYPIQLKTNSTTGSQKKLSFSMLTSDGQEIGGSDFAIQFGPSFVWYWKHCCNAIFLQFDGTIPAEVEKIWQFTKTATALQVKCNDVIVLDLVFTERGSGTSCVDSTSGREATKLQIQTGTGGDTATDQLKLIIRKLYRHC